MTVKIQNRAWSKLRAETARLLDWSSRVSAHGKQGQADGQIYGKKVIPLQ